MDSVINKFLIFYITPKVVFNRLIYELIKYETQNSDITCQACLLDLK